MIDKRLLACLVLTATLLPAGLFPAAVGAQERRPTVSPSLEPLIERPTPQIPEILRGPLGAYQGSKRLAGREALSLHLRTSASREELEALGVRVRTLRNGRATVTVLPENLPALVSHPKVSSIAVPRLAHPVLSKSLPDTGIPMLRTFSNGSFTGATGAGVVVGIVDSGIDIDHPNFADAQGDTRIAFLWDQTGSATPHPAPYGYGTECTAADIDGGLCTEQDEASAFGHGTHVAGTAAGNGAAPDENGVPWKHVGVAPESRIVFVKTSFQTDDIIDALEYIFAKADQLGLPAVINLSLGSELGAHDGTDPMEETIDDLVTAQPGRAVVVAAGNSRGDATHAQADTTLNVNVAGPRFFVPSYTARSGAGNDLVVISGYYHEADAVTVQLITPSGEAYNRSLTTSTCSAEINGLDGTVQICNTRSSTLGQGTTANEILIIVYDKISTKPPRQGSWKINLTGDTISGAGEVDFWITSRLGTDSSKVAYFSTLVDTSETLGIPGTSRQAITVGAHVTRVCWKDSNGNSQSYPSPPATGDIAPFSSFGPTRDGRAKPEISAPGMGIVAPLADEVRNAVINAGYGAIVVSDDYLLLQGTSMAAPHVTGAVALLLQADPAATNATLRSRLSSSARDDAFTREHDAGIGFLSSNYSFGAGKLDLGDWAYADPHETNDTSSQAYAVLSSQPLSGYIEHPDDVDYFQLQGAMAGDTVDVQLTSLPQNYALALQNRSLSFNVCVTGSMTTQASSNNAGTANESVLYTLPTGVLVGPASYIRVTSPTGAVHSSDSYQVRALLTRPETTGTHNSVATSQKLPDFLEMKVTGAIASAVADFYSFKIQTGSTIVLSAAGRIVSVRNSAGTTVATGLNTVSYTVPGIFFGPTTHHAVVSGGLNATYTLNLKIQ